MMMRIIWVQLGTPGSPLSFGIIRTTTSLGTAEPVRPARSAELIPLPIERSEPEAGGLKSAFLKRWDGSGEFISRPLEHEARWRNKFRVSAGFAADR